MDKNSKSYQDWLLKAENDLKSAKGIWGYYEKPPTDTICYHCHQTTEKALKGFLIYTKGEFTKIHDLIALLNLCLLKDKSLKILRDAVKILNKYYIEAKYPLDMPIDYPRHEAEEAIEKAEFVLNVIKDRMKKQDKKRG